MHVQQLAKGDSTDSKPKPNIKPKFLVAQLDFDQPIEIKIRGIIEFEMDIIHQYHI